MTKQDLIIQYRKDTRLTPLLVIPSVMDSHDRCNVQAYIQWLEDYVIKLSKVSGVHATNTILTVQKGTISSSSTKLEGK